MTAGVQPTTLRWALERAGLGPADAERAVPGAGRWLRGDGQPELEELEALASLTRTALPFLLGAAPPAEELPIPDFRSANGRVPSRPSLELLDTVYQCQNRQAWFQEHARREGLEPVDWVASTTPDADPEEAAAALCTRLGVDDAARARWPDKAAAFRDLRARVEAEGVLVMVNGVVGSHTGRSLRVEEFRGFALADPLAPLVFINGKDTDAGRSFTLFHEVAHLLLGESAVSDAPAKNPGAAAPAPASRPARVEAWCNRVAAATLAPAAQVAAAVGGGGDLLAGARALARRLKVSTLVVLLRAIELDYVPAKTAWPLYRQEADAVAAALARRAEEPKGPGGGNFYDTTKSRLGARFARAVIRSARSGDTLYRDAHRLLGIAKESTFERLAAEVGAG